MQVHRAADTGKQEAKMQKRYYNDATLRAALDAFEKGYALSSDDFYRAYRDGTVEGVSARHRLPWATFYERWKCLRGEADFAAKIEREFEPA
jgi:hypothetical protein